MRPEQPVFGTNVAFSINTNWRNLPPILHKVKSYDCLIHKAKYCDEWTTMHIKTPINIHQSISIYDELQNGTYNPNTVALYSPGLPFNTSIYMYNISTCPYTVLDFGCRDRTGLFCEIIEVLSKYDIDVKGAYINTIGDAVNNIFYLTRDNDVLSTSYIDYIRNSLQSEIKQIDNDSY